MFPDKKGAGGLVCARCSTSKQASKADRTTTMTKGEDKEMLVITEKTDTLPKTKINCEKCGNNEAYWVIRQTRAADEPSTRIYQCVKCMYKWREYQ